MGVTFGAGRGSPALLHLRRLLRPTLGAWPYGLPTDLEDRYWLTVKAEIVAPDLPAQVVFSSTHRIRRGTGLTSFLLTVLPADCYALILRIVTPEGPQRTTHYQRLLTATAVQYLVLPNSFTDEDFTHLASEVRVRSHLLHEYRRSRSRSPECC